MNFFAAPAADQISMDKLRIGIVGDIIAADSPSMSGQGVYSSCQGNYDPLFSLVREFSKNYDFLIGNFEVVLVEKISEVSPNALAMKAPLALAETLRNCKFKYLSIANNHTMEYGARAFSRMCERLQIAGIETFGHKAKPFLIVHDSKRDIRIGLLAFSTIPAMYGYEPEYYFLDIHDSLGEERLLSGIRSAKKSCDHLLVLPHWGNEFIERPAPWQFDLAERIVDAGADVILGSHAHIIQHAVHIHGRPVFFGLGNFLSDYFQDRLKKNLFVTVTCDRKSLEVNNQVFSTNRKFVIYSTDDSIDIFNPPPKNVPYLKYSAEANRQRNKVRRELILYLIKNPKRLLFCPRNWSWLMRRMIFLLLNRRRIKKNPNAVYSGPLH